MSTSKVFLKIQRYNPTINPRKITFSDPRFIAINLKATLNKNSCKLLKSLLIRKLIGKVCQRK
jgi:hypothetical protein